MSHAPRLLLFNLMTDDADPVLGFAGDWIRVLAARCEYVDVLTMYRGTYLPPDNVRVFSAGREHGLSKAARVAIFYRQLVAAAIEAALRCLLRPYDAAIRRFGRTLADGARHIDNAVVHPPAAVGCNCGRGC